MLFFYYFISNNKFVEERFFFNAQENISILKNVLCILCSSEMLFFYLNAGNIKNLSVS